MANRFCLALSSSSMSIVPAPMHATTPKAHVGATLLPTRSSKVEEELEPDVLLRFLPRTRTRMAAVHTPPHRMMLHNGTMLADQPLCKAALQRTAVHTHMQRSFPSSISWSPSAHLAYFKTAKAGSESFKAYFAEHLDDAVFRRYDDGDFRSAAGAIRDAADVLTGGVLGFTFVRDPMARALAAYAEVDAFYERAKSTGNVQRQLRRAGTTCAHP